MYHLQRFLDAQNDDNQYQTAWEELKSGNKKGYSIWFMLPQLKGLGNSPQSQYYGIDGLDEAKAYLENTILKYRLTHTIALISAQLDIDENNLELLMGSRIDTLKTISSLTLFTKAGLEEAATLLLRINKYCDLTINLLSATHPK